MDVHQMVQDGYLCPPQTKKQAERAAAQQAAAAQQQQQQQQQQMQQMTNFSGFSAGSLQGGVFGHGQNSGDS